MSDNKELLPCPFCQHKVISLHAHSRRANTAGGYHHFVRCPRCHTEGPRSLSGKDDAIAAWNRRAAQPVVLSDDAVNEGIRAYIQAGKRSLDLYGAMREAILAAKEQANG